MSVCPFAPDSSDFGDVCALFAPFLHQLTMQSSLFERGCPVLVVVCVARKLRPCPSYSRRRDRINLGLWRSLYKGGGGGHHLLQCGSGAEAWEECLLPSCWCCTQVEMQQTFTQQHILNTDLWALNVKLPLTSEHRKRTLLWPNVMWSVCLQDFQHLGLLLDFSIGPVPVQVVLSLSKTTTQACCSCSEARLRPHQRAQWRAHWILQLLLSTHVVLSFRPPSPVWCLLA